MRVTTVPFDLLAWCRRMGTADRPLPQPDAAALLGMSVSGYRSMEARNKRTGRCSATVAKLAQLLEETRVGGEPCSSS